MVTEGDLTWGGEHTIQCTDDVLWNCASETCKILLTSVTPINSIKKDFSNKNKNSVTKKENIFLMTIVHKIKTIYNTKLS